MNKKYSKKFLIAELNRFIKENSTNPTSKSMCGKNGYPCIESYKKHFGSWSAALKEFGIEQTIGKPRKYKINQDFFKIWSNEMAYILGFWFADGGMYHNFKRNNYTVSFTSKDKEYLHKILNVMESDYPLKDKKDGSFVIQIDSKIMYNSLLELNGTDNKSLTAKPPFISKEYVYDFIRGYMDGDGWISIRYRRNNYPTLGFIGTKEMMDMLISYLGYPNYYERRYPKKETNTFIIHYYAENAIAILNNLYRNASLYMDRKYQKYEEGLKWNRTITLTERKGAHSSAGQAHAVSCA